ncbi:hypothetical protein X975_23807, partial [Stegodyphus mimosarum]
MLYHTHTHTQKNRIYMFADDIALVARSQRYPIKGFEAIEMEAKPVGLLINQDKIKYMTTIGNTSLIEDYKFERVTGFIYLGLMFNANNDILPKIKK